MPEVPLKDAAPVTTEPERVQELIQVLSRFSAVELAAATRTLGFLMMAPDDCRCKWTQVPVLQDPVLTYDRAAEKLTVEMTVKGQFRPEGGRGRGVNKCRCEVDVYREDQGKWKILHDDASGAQWKDHRFECVGGPDALKDFECKHSVELPLDNIEIQGAVLRLLLEVYWQVEGCGGSFGGDRLYRRCDITLKRVPNERNLKFELVFVDNAFSETVPAAR